MAKITDTTLKSDVAQGRRRNRKGEETRQRVLAAAISCLHEKGYANTSIEAVMTFASLSRGSVLNQFPTRLDLMCEAAHTAMQLTIVQSRSLLEKFSDPLERLFGHIEVIWAGQNTKEGAAITEILLAARWDHELGERLKPIAENIEAHVDELVETIAREAGIENISEYQLHVRVLILSLRGITIESMYDEDRDIMRRALDRLRQMHKRQCDRLLAGADKA